MDIETIFRQTLEKHKEEGKIDILYRGCNRDKVVSFFKEGDKKTNEDIVNKLFFFGQKSDFTLADHDQIFGLNEINEEILGDIFDDYHNIITSSKDNGTKEFLDKNEEVLCIFRNPSNKVKFCKQILEKDKTEQLSDKNYLLQILHQIGGESFHKKRSCYVSSTDDKNIGNQFSRNINDNISCPEKQTLITFWSIKKDKYSGDFEMICPYPEERELSILGAIFPHYIYSINIGNKEFINSNINNENMQIDIIEYYIYKGIPIDQEEFIKRAIEEINSNSVIMKSEDGIKNQPI